MPIVAIVEPGVEGGELGVELGVVGKEIYSWVGV